MKVKNWTMPDVVTVAPDTSVKKAFYQMKSLGIRHLPVVKNGKLVGIVTDRDLRRPQLSDTFKEWDELYRINDEISVEDVMITPVMTTTPDTSIKGAAKQMAHHRIGALPVVDKKGKLVGIITESDALRAFVSRKA